MNTDKSKLVWFKQSFGELPQLVLRQVDNTFRPGAGFKDRRFNVKNNKSLHIDENK